MDFVDIVLRCAVAVAAVIVLVRLNGLRSFAKMEGFGFALTVATGSILATIMTSADAVWPGLVALAMLFALRYALSKARFVSDAFGRAVDNSPVFLLHDGEILDDNLRMCRITRPDLMSKLREANALDLSQVRAVVMEATGDVSVLHGDGLDPAILEGVSWGRCTPRRAAPPSPSEGGMV